METFLVCLISGLHLQKSSGTAICSASGSRKRSVTGFLEDFGIQMQGNSAKKTIGERANDENLL